MGSERDMAIAEAREAVLANERDAAAAESSPLNKAEAHRLAHKLRDPKFYTARTKRAVNSGGAL